MEFEEMSETKQFADISVTTERDRIRLTDTVTGESVTMGQGTHAQAISRFMWNWNRERKAASGYEIDTRDGARNVVLFWNRKCASNAEARIIEAILACDENLRERFQDAFPELCIPPTKREAREFARLDRQCVCLHSGWSHGPSDRFPDGKGACNSNDYGAPWNRCDCTAFKVNA